jgi:hypothetical protein
MPKLTAKAVQNAKPGRVGDGDGLWLATSPTLKRRWIIRFSQAGRVNEKALGSYPYMSLADARAAAFDFKRNLCLGIAPPRKITFGEIANEVLASKNHLRSSTASQMGTHLSHCAPLADRHIGSLSVDDCVALDIKCQSP